MVLQISGILTEHHERALPRPIPLHPSIKPDPFLAVKDVPIWPEMSRTPLDQQAVSVPQDEARKEIFHWNSLHSPLLRLPTDVRYEIYKVLLGDRLVHLRHRLGLPDKWKHVVCQQKENNGYYPDRKVLISHKYALDEWEPPHDECRYETYYDPDVESPTYQSHERMHLSILRSCRQVYFEASQVLWATNLFSLHDSLSMECFLENRTPIQLGMMTKIRLRFDFTNDDIKGRRRALTSDALQAMGNVRSLRLIIQEAVPERLLQLKKLTGRSMTELSGNHIELDLHDMCQLRLNHVDVHVIPPLPHGSYDLRWEEGQLTPEAKEWRAEYEKISRQYLLGPDSIPQF